MMFSKEIIRALTDLIENKLAIMQIANCDDLRERLLLQRALSELRGGGMCEAGGLKDFIDIPRRGRRRKVSDIISDQGRL